MDAFPDLETPLPKAKAETETPAPVVDAETLRTALAELEDAKRRVARDAERQLERQRAQVLEALLPVLDNLERSIAAASAAGTAPGLVDGVRLVHGQFLSALAGFGLERRSAVGSPRPGRTRSASSPSRSSNSPRPRS